MKSFWTETNARQREREYAGGNMKRVTLVLGLLTTLSFAVSLAAQPFGAYLIKGSGNGYVAIPASSAFDFTNGFTFEPWASVSDNRTCSSLAGKAYTRALWLAARDTPLPPSLRPPISLSSRDN